MCGPASKGEAADEISKVSQTPQMAFVGGVCRTKVSLFGL